MLESVLALKELGIQVSDPAGPAAAPHYDTADTITVPDAHLLFNGDFKRVGTTGLKITGEDGKSYFIQDYFSGEKHKHLLSPEGAMLSANVVAALAGPLAPGQMAQAGAQPAVQAVVGRVDAISGSCTVVRNGVTVSLNMGDTVRKGDVVQTSVSSQISIVFTDGSTFSLSANARMVLDEFVYNAGGGNNSAMINLVQGTFSFVAGQVAKTGDMRVETPVATIGIRGTAVLVEISANDGQTKFSVMVEPNGVTGSFNLYNKTTGALIATVNSSQVGWLVTPSGPLQVVAQAVNKTPADLQQELGIVQQLFNIFNNFQQNPIDPNQQDPSQRGDNQSPQNTGAVGSGGAPSSNQPTTYNVTITQLPGNNVVTPQNPPPLAGTNPNPSPNPNPNANTNPDPTNTNTNPNPSSPDTTGQEPTVPLPTGTFNIIYGTAGNDHLIGTSGDDFVYAGDGDDLITAGHGGGNDVYDGGLGHDKIEYPSATHGVVFQLNNGTYTLPDGQVVKSSTADGDETGHDIFVRVEEIIGGQGNDTFILNDGAHWVINGGSGDDTFVLRQLTDSVIDGGAGLNDTVRLDGALSIRDGDKTPTLSNIEIIDLNTTNANVLDLDVQMVIDANDDHVLVVNGNSQDAVNFLNIHGQNGHWELVTDIENPDYRPGYDMYRFVPDYYYGNGEEPLPTVYVQQGINTDGAGDQVKDHIIENVTAWIWNSEGYTFSVESMREDLLDATIESADVLMGGYALLRVDGSDNLYYRITGNFSFAPGEILRVKGGIVTGIAIETRDEYGNVIESHATFDGFNFSAVDFFNAIQDPTGATSSATLNALLSSASYSFFGSEGADVLNGSNFRDTLNGGDGNDILTGNGGPDTFVYSAGDDRITDFTIGQDKIDLTALNFIHSMADLLPRAHQVGNDVVITINGGPEPDRLRLEGVTLSDLGDSDFVFFRPEDLEEQGAGEGHNDTSSLAYKVLSPSGGSTTFVSDGWSNGSAYRFVWGNVTWTAAQTAALAMGGYLANITSAEENAYIRQHVTYGSYAWIGATDQDTEGNWVWANGPEAGTMFWQGAGEPSGGVAYGYNNWWGDEPTNDGGFGDYAYIDSNAAWTDAVNNAGEVSGYVVEFQTYTKIGVYGSLSYNVATGELIYTLNDADPDTQALAAGQTVTEHFDLAFLAAGNQTITRSADFTIHGANDAPEFVIASGDSTSKNLYEVHAGLQTAGSLHAFDVDAGSHLTISVSEVSASGPVSFTDEQLRSFFHATNPGSDGKITWTFDSGSEAFGGLAPGQTLYLHYTVQVSDGMNIDEQTVNVTIKNNIAPTTSDDSYTGNEDTLTSVYLNGSDQDGSISGYKLLQLPDYGTLHEAHSGYMGPALTLQDLISSNSLVFKPDADWSGSTDFKFAAIDDSGAQSNASTGSITVNSMPEAPAINVNSASVVETWGEFGALKTLLNLHVTDADALPLEDFSVEAYSYNGGVLSLADATLNSHIGTPGTSFSFDTTLPELAGLQDGIIYVQSSPTAGLTDRVTFRVTDGDSHSSVVNFYFSVNGDQAVNFAGTYDDDVMFDTRFDDTFYGYPGRDTFVFSKHDVYLPGQELPVSYGSGHDRINDFAQGEDKIMLIDLVEGINDLHFASTDYGSGTLITWGEDGDSITLTNFNRTLTANDFIFRYQPESI